MYGLCWYVTTMQTLTALVLTLVLGASIAGAEGKKPAAPTAGCPPAVIISASRAFPGAKITACKAAKEAGSEQFEVKLTRKVGGAIQVDFASNGNVLQIEEPIAINKLPDAVAKAFKAKYPKVRANRAEKQTITDKGVFFEIAFKADGKTKEATFAAAGAFVKKSSCRRGVRACRACSVRCWVCQRDRHPVDRPWPSNRSMPVDTGARPVPPRHQAASCSRAVPSIGIRMWNVVPTPGVVSKVSVP